jgi:molecular chaperone DnaK
MIKDAEAHAVDDKKRKDGVEAKNHGEALLHSTEKTVAEYGSKVSEGDRRSIEDAMAGLRESLKGEDTEAITTKTNELMQASTKLGEAISAQSQNNSGNSNQPPNNDQENIVDAEFTEVNDKTAKKKSA